jgi:uncharacterized membrane protein
VIVHNDQSDQADQRADGTDNVVVVNVVVVVTSVVVVVAVVVAAMVVVATVVVTAVVVEAGVVVVLAIRSCTRHILCGHGVPVVTIAPRLQPSACSGQQIKFTRQ